MGDTITDTFSSSSSVGSGGSQVSSKMMVGAIIVLFMVILFVFSLHLYARWFWSRRASTIEAHSTQSISSGRSVLFNSEPAAQTGLVGLEPSMLRALPILTFHSHNFKEGGLECSVCLSELQDGEKARLLPACNHGFHVDCIDMWFQSHSTCPLCRSTVVIIGDSSSSTQTQSSQDHLEPGYSTESPNFPTNVLYLGNESLVTTRTTTTAPDQLLETSSSPRDASLVVEIPSRRPTDGFTSSSQPSPATSFSEDQVKSPMMTRLMSLRRLLSKEKRVRTCNQSSVDIEQGQGVKDTISESSS